MRFSRNSLRPYLPEQIHSQAFLKTKLSIISVNDVRRINARTPYILGNYILKYKITNFMQRIVLFVPIVALYIVAADLMI